jgi:hypothetical protein
VFFRIIILTFIGDKIMWIISWVEIDCTMSYHPRYSFAKTYEQARDIKSDIEDRFEQQDEHIKDSNDDKICSEVYIEEIKF